MDEFDDLEIPDAEVYHLKLPKRDDIFARLRSETAWQQRSIHIMGRTVRQPRLTAWYGDPEASYTYSGLKHDPLPWTETLTLIREQLFDMLGAQFNSVLLNLYRDGNDSIGFHSDNEVELGERPVIASVSFGATRKITFRHKKSLHLPVHVKLADHDLLIMAGDTQKNWLHGIEKTSKAGQRINLTFRTIYHK